MHILKKRFSKYPSSFHLIFSFSSLTPKPYYPIKKLDFSKTEFQCIYKNTKLPCQAKLIGRSIALGFLPSGIYLAYYLAFLDLKSLWNISLLGFTIGFGFYHAFARMNIEGLFVYEFYIDKTGRKFQAFLTKNATKFKEKDLIKVEFNEENIKEREIVNEGLVKEEEGMEDQVVFTVNKKINDLRLFDMKLYLKENKIVDCNEYLIAMGKGLKIMMR